MSATHVSNLSPPVLQTRLSPTFPASTGNPLIEARIHHLHDLPAQRFHCSIWHSSYVGWGMQPSWLERQIVTTQTQVRFPSAARDFFSQIQLSVQTLLRVSVHPPCANACINICAHVKDRVVHVRVWWIMATYTNRSSTNHSDKITNSMIVVAQ